MSPASNIKLQWCVGQVDSCLESQFCYQKVGFFSPNKMKLMKGE